MLRSKIPQLKNLRRIASNRFFFTRSNEQEDNSKGLFGNEILKSASDFTKLNKDVRARTDEIVKEILEGRPDRTTVQLFDDLSNEICKAADMVECVRQLHSDPKYNEAAEESARDFCNLVESLNTFSPLYKKLKSSKEKESSRLDSVDHRTLDLFLEDFEQSGVHLESEKRERFVRLSEDIFDAGAHFQWGCDKEVEIGRGERKKYGIESSKLFTPITHSVQREKRKFIYTSFYKHNHEQEAHLRRLVLSRHNLAQLTGYESYSHRAQYNTLLGTYENARNFLWGVIEACRPAAEKELAVLMDVQSQCQPGCTEVGEWDLYFLSHVYKERAFGRSHLHLAEKYLNLGNVMKGFIYLTNKLYGVRFQDSPVSRGETWPGTVIKWEVTDSLNNLLGHIYMDVDRRNSKASGDCHYTVRCSKELASGEWQTPIVVLSLGLTDSLNKDWKTISLSVHAAENLFHELGHAMHSMLGRTKYQHVAGTRCPQDFSEIPSNLMEYFFNDLTVMKTILTSSNGQNISLEEAASLIASRFAFSSLEIIQQAAYALFDLELHGPEAHRFTDSSFSTTYLFHSILKTSLPQLARDPDSAFQHRFAHLVQYGGRYYSYLVARAAASLVYNSKFQKDPFSIEAGLKWNEVQSHGGSLPPGKLLQMILGFSPTSSHLVEALQKESFKSSNLGVVSV